MTGNPCAHAALHRSLLEFWCRARGWTLKTIEGDRAVIDQGAGDVVWTAGDLFAAVVRSAGEPAELAALSWLRDRTYVVRHNPNCPKSFEIRIPGRAGTLDARPPGAVGPLGYGGTLTEAVADLRESVATDLSDVVDAPARHDSAHGSARGPRTAMRAG